MEKPDPIFGGLFASRRVTQQLGIRSPQAEQKSDVKGEAVPPAPAKGDTGPTGNDGTDGSENGKKDDSSTKEE